METTNISAADVANALTEAVRSSPGPVPGSLLSAHIRLKFPGFQASDFRCRNLKDFIAQYATNLELAGLAGLDPQYRLRGSATDTTLPSQPESSTGEDQVAEPLEIPPPRKPLAPAPHRFDPNVFRSFANPSGNFVVYGNRRTGELRAQPTGNPDPGPDWVRIASMSRAMHIQMARSYIASLPEADRTILEPLIDADSQWHTKFWQKTIDLNLESAWKKFRFDRIMERLIDALNRNAVPLRPNSGAAPRERPGAVERLTETQRPFADHNSQTVERKVALRVVEQMSINELRSIRLTLGEFIDALDEK